VRSGRGWALAVKGGAGVGLAEGEPCRGDKGRSRGAGGEEKKAKPWPRAAQTIYTSQCRVPPITGRCLHEPLG
jgi:hypothetical protein